MTADCDIIYLDPLGGVSGDMFISAVLDTWPNLGEPMLAAIASAGLSNQVHLSIQPHRDHCVGGTRFTVRQAGEPSDHQHVTLSEIRDRLRRSELARNVLDRALAIFEHLGKAESEVHGIPIEDVELHEVGSWDSIADIVGAAFLIESLQVSHWLCGPLPLGSGRVKCAHGILPIPAPAVAILLRGFPFVGDDFEGERVTPTGAAILRHIGPRFSPPGHAMILRRCGTGFGTREFPGMSNTLRLLAFGASGSVASREEVAVISFEIDDQTSEDLAVGLEHLRSLPGAIDVIQIPAVGKKGRMIHRIQVLIRPDSLQSVAEACFSTTTTIGLRWQVMNRLVLDRETRDYSADEGSVSVKVCRRPGGILTGKAEMEDLTEFSHDRAKRANLRQTAENSVVSKKPDDE